MSKTSLLLALALATPTAAFANEVSAGAFELQGGSRLELSSTTFDAGVGKSTQSTIGLDASGLYYLTPQLALGGELRYEDTRYKDPGFPSSSQTSYIIGPKVAYEIPLAPRLAGYGEAFLGLAKMDFDATELTGWGLGLGAGVKYFFTRSVSGNAGLSYTIEKVSGSGVDVDVSNLTLGVSISIYLGNGAAGH